MSSSSEVPARYKLRADAKFPAATVSIFDGQYGIVAEGADCIQADVAAGLYMVQFKAGQLFEKQTMAVSEDTLVEAKTLSRQDSPPLRLPEWTGSAEGQSGLYLRAEGEHGETFLSRMTVLNAARESAATLMVSPGAPGTSGQRNVRLKPGQYLLRVTVAAGQSLEQTIFIPPGWQAQIFFRADGENAQEADFCRWMSNAAILLFPENYEYVASRQDREALEAGLQNLSVNRPAAPARALFHEQAGANPMLGIIAAHQWLRETLIYGDLFAQAVQKLESTMGLHPDVTALKLRTGTAASGVVFDLPPMLRNSWKIVVEQSVKTPSIVPADSWAALAAGGMTGARGWLVWRTPDPGRKILDLTTGLADSLADVRAKVSALATGKSDTQIRHLINDFSLGGVEGPLLAYLIGVARTEDTTRKLVDSLYKSGIAGVVVRYLSRFLPGMSLVPKELILDTATKFIQTRSSAESVIRNLEVPQVALRSALASLGPKLVAMASKTATMGSS